MTLQLMPKDDLFEWLGSIAREHRLVGPKRKQAPKLRQGGDTAGQPHRPRHVFDDVQSADELVLLCSSTILPPRKLLLPQVEELFRFENGGQRSVVRLEEQAQVIFGIHTCDLHAIHMLDQVFSQTFPDQHYLARRRNTTLVSVECLEPCSGDAFCRDMGTWRVPESFDLHLTDLGSEFAIMSGSAKGSELLKLSTKHRPATEADEVHFKRVVGAKSSRFPFQLEATFAELPSLLSASYRSPVWDEIGQRCLGCGVCTIVCPTCHCFDVQDELDFDLENGRRYRVWDSCQLNQFASVAGGHDFRSSRSSRLRHRFRHKFQYQTERYQMAGCVGCGRCAEACLVNISPVDVLNDLQRREIGLEERRQETIA